MGRWSEVAKNLNSPFSELPLTAINREEGLMAVNGSPQKREIEKKSEDSALESEAARLMAVNGSVEKGNIPKIVKREWADHPLEGETPAPTLEPLPGSLERMVRAATNDALPGGVTKLSSGLVMDLNGYVLRWACCYLIGDRAEASRRLLEAYSALHGGKA